MSIGNNIRALRKQNGITQAEFASSLGVTKETVCRWERGHTEIRQSTIRRIAEKYNVAYDLLVSENTGLATTKTHFREASRKPPNIDAFPVFRIAKTRGHSGLIKNGEASAPLEIMKEHHKGFFVQILGHEMSKCYPSGSLLLVDPLLRPWNGCSVVAIGSEDAPVIRRFSSGNNLVILSSYSFGTAEPDLILDKRRVRILGVIVWFQASHDIRPELIQ